MNRNIYNRGLQQTEGKKCDTKKGLTKTLKKQSLNERQVSVQRKKLNEKFNLDMRKLVMVYCEDID